MRLQDRLSSWISYALVDGGEGGRAQDFKGKIGNLQVDQKEQIRGKQIFARPPRNNWTER